MLKQQSSNNKKYLQLFSFQTYSISVVLFFYSHQELRTKKNTMFYGFILPRSSTSGNNDIFLAFIMCFTLEFSR